MIDDAPLHMDEESRMERLYRHLLAMGLVVDPIFEAGAKVALRVSIGLPQERAGEASETRVFPPVERTQIAEFVPAAEKGRGNVVDFPTEFR